VEIQAAEVHDWLAQGPLADIIASIGDFLEVIPPEIAVDIVDRGLMFTGGGSLLARAMTRISAGINLPCHVDRDPQHSTIRGTAAVLENMSGHQTLLEPLRASNTEAAGRPTSSGEEKHDSPKERPAAVASSPTGSASTPMAPPPHEGPGAYVFVSYKREDMPLVAPYLHRLIEWGYKPWYDRGIPGGAEWDALIEEKVRGCRALVVFLTQAAADSKWVRREIKFADRESKPILAIRLGSLALHSGLDILLNQYQTIDGTARDFESELRRAMQYVRLL
jgi:hypothetical protein